MKSQVKRVAERSALADQVLRAVLAHQRDAGLGERAELLERDVLDGGEDLDVAGSARPVAAARSPRARARGSRARRAGVEAVDQLRHATPPGAR